jgi:hypothetical protein
MRLCGMRASLGWMDVDAYGREGRTCISSNMNQLACQAMWNLGTFPGAVFEKCIGDWVWEDDD